jgi:PAB-dependent poly(A)-specific ribonuclease subunit 3
MANALRVIHGAGLAARIIDPSKILLTSKNRIRLNGCGILDIVQFEANRNLLELQREDFVQIVRLILSIGTNNPTITPHNYQKALDQFSRNYSLALRDQVVWLLNMTTLNKTESIDRFISSVEPHLMTAFDRSLHANDQLTTELNRELENSRLVRLMTKLNFITERPDFSHDRQWAETGERYPIKLFRDYVFHQVNAQGNPVLDLGHIISCLNKLDAGTEEKVTLTTRDEQVVIVCSYKELKRSIDNAYGDLAKAARRGQGQQ